MSAVAAGGRMRKSAELVRFLGKDAAEIERMMKEDELPHLMVPGRTKPSPRFFLPDVHSWLCKYAKGQGAAVMNYGEFLRAFESAQGGKL